MSVNRTELVAQIAERADLTKAKADEALAAFQAVLVESLAKGEAVKVTGLLSVERVERAARTDRAKRRGGLSTWRLCIADPKRGGRRLAKAWVGGHTAKRASCGLRGCRRGCRAEPERCTGWLRRTCPERAKPGRGWLGRAKRIGRRSLVK